VAVVALFGIAITFHLIDENIEIFIVLVDQEDNPNQSRSFEGEDDLSVGKELQDLCQMQYIFQSS
jgi:hypothetical protein